MKIAAIDLSTNVGLAIFDPAKDFSSIECWHWKLKGDDELGYGDDLILTLAPWLREHQPDMVVVEMPLKRVVTNANTMALMWHLYGVSQGVIRGLKIKMSCVPPRVWQAVVLKATTADMTKKAALAVCEQFKIKSATNEHKRDAACIAIWASLKSQEMKMLQRTMENASA